MIRLFVSQYLFIVIALVGLSALLESLIYDDAAEQQDLSQLGQILLQVDDPDKWQTIATQANMDVSIMPLESVALPMEELATLNQSGFFTAFGNDGSRHIYLLQNDNTLVHFTLAEDSDSTSFLWYSISFFILLALLVALWSYPLWRDIRRLETSASSLRSDGSIDDINVSVSSPVHNIADALQKLSTQVTSLLKDQRELTSAVAHEFRTPLARLKFSAESVEPSSLQASMKDDLQELESLVQEMLEFSQSQHNQPELIPAEINFESLFQGLIQQLPANKIAHLTIEQKSQCSPIIADGHFVERAIMNLLNNAIKYADSKILVSAQEHKDEIQVIVEDDGPGIPDDIQKAVFEPFFRPDSSRNREQGGAGLGLATVQKIMSWHEGKVWVENSEMGGAKFVLAFPNSH